MPHQLAPQDLQGHQLLPRRAYPTDFSDQEWATLEPLVPQAIAYPNLQQPVHSRREIMKLVFRSASDPEVSMDWSGAALDARIAVLRVLK